MLQTSVCACVHVNRVHMFECMAMWVGEILWRNMEEERGRIVAHRQFCFVSFCSILLRMTDITFSVYLQYLLCPSLRTHHQVVTFKESFTPNLATLLPPPCFFFFFFFNYFFIFMQQPGWPCHLMFSWKPEGKKEGEREGVRRMGGNETCVFSLMADFLAPLLRLSGSVAAKRRPPRLIKNVPEDIRALQ